METFIVKGRGKGEDIKESREEGRGVKRHRCNKIDEAGTKRGKPLLFSVINGGNLYTYI